MGFKCRDLGINVTCGHCKGSFDVFVNQDDFISWQSGVAIQRAMPYLTPGQRELFISKTCEPCFDKMFGDQDGS